MDFITSLPRSTRNHYYIMVVVDKLKKETHFIPFKSTHIVNDIAKIFMRDIFILYGLHKEIVSHVFKVNELFQELSTELNFSIAYHPKMEDQIERVNQVLEDMLRIYVMDKSLKWGDYLHLVEFSYNNGHQSYLGMSPYWDLYGR